VAPNRAVAEDGPLLVDLELGGEARREPVIAEPAGANKALDDSPKTRDMLSEILIEAVANRGSVSFMHPLAPEAAKAFWDDALTGVVRDERIVLGAWDGEVLAGTVTLLLDCAPNQPRQAEIAKLMTRLSHRRRSVAAALMRAAEDCAVKRERTLLVLITASDERGIRAVREVGVHTSRRDSGLCAEAAWRVDRDDDLLEADRKATRKIGLQDLQRFPTHSAVIR
jgi:GNAT superfamily N-acetyltransferase